MNPNRRRDRLREIQSIADTLRDEEIVAPDFTDVIIQRVHEQRPFLAQPARKLLWACRIGAVSLLVGVVGVIVLIQTTAPVVTQITTPDQPVCVSPLVDSVRSTTMQARNTIRSGIDSFNRAIESSPATSTVVAEAVPAQYEPGQASIVLVSSSASSSPAPVSTKPGRYTPNVSHSGMPVVYAALVAPMDEVRPISFGTLDGVPRASASGPSWSLPVAYTASGARSDFASAGHVAPGSSRGSIFFMPESFIRSAQPIRCNLLDDFAPLLTGQPASEGLVPR